MSKDPPAPAHEDQARRNDPLLGALRALPQPAQDRARATRTHERARRLFLAQAGQGPVGRWRMRLARLYRHAEPLLAASIVILYLGWAFETAAWLFR